jgi:hypothetical protein
VGCWSKASIRIFVRASKGRNGTGDGCLQVVVRDVEMRFAGQFAVENDRSCCYLIEC